MGIDVETWRARIGLYHAASVGRHLKKQHKAAGRPPRRSRSGRVSSREALDTLLHILVTCLLALLYTDIHFVFPYLSKATKFHNFDQKVLGFISSGMNACRGVVMRGLALPKSTLVALSLLLIISGDVELNPGPVKDLNIKNLTNALSKVQSKWYDIGIQLEIEVSVLNRIENDFRGQSNRQLSSVLSYWLDNNTETQVTWETIVDALESSSVNEKGLAIEIKTRYCQSTVTDSASQELPTQGDQPEVTEPLSPNPQNVPSKFTFPLLNKSNMSKSDLEDLETRLRLETRRIMEQFNMLLCNFCKSLGDGCRKISLDDFVSNLHWRLKVYPKIVIESQEKPADQQGVTVRNATSFDDAFEVIDDHCSFFDFELVENLIEEFGTESDKTRVEDYKVKFQEYAKRKVFECPSRLKEGECGGDTQICFKLDSRYKCYTLDAIKDLKCSLCKILNLSPNVLVLQNIDDGCIELTFGVPSVLPQSIFPISPDQRAALSKLGVLLLFSGDRREFISTEATSDSSAHSFDPSGRGQKAPSSQMDNEGEFSTTKYFGTVTPTKIPRPDSTSIEQNAGETNDAVGALVSEQTPNPAEHDENRDNSSELIATKFSELVDSFSSSLCNQDSYTPRDLVRFLWESEQYYVFPNDPQKRQIVFREYEKELSAASDAKSIEKVFEVFKHFCSFFNYDLIEDMIQEFGTIEDKRQLSRYLEDFDQYANRAVHELPLRLNWTSVPPGKSLKLDLKLGSKCNTYTAKEIRLLRAGICEALDLQLVDQHLPCALLFDSWQKNSVGCIELVFQAPCFLLKELVPLSQGQKRSIDGHSVLSFNVSRYTTDIGSELRSKEDIAASTELYSLYTTDCRHDDFEEDFKYLGDPNLKLSSGIEDIAIEDQDQHVDCQENFNKQLHHASYSRNLKAVQRLVRDKKADVSCGNVNKYGFTPLHLACESGSLDIVRYLATEMQKNDTLVSVLNMYTKDGRTLLHIASGFGHLDIVKYLTSELKCEPTILSRDKGLTPLNFAARGGHLEIVKYLVEEQDCDPMAKTPHNYNTPLHNAAQFGHLDVVKYLVATCKCNPDVKAKQECLPLHYACENGHLKVVKYLLDETLLANYNMSVRNMLENQIVDGCAPLHLASCYGHLDIVKFLISDLKCDPNITTPRFKMTPLHFAARGGYLAMVVYLVNEHHCDPMRKTKNKQNTSLHLAAREGKLDIVKFFVETCGCSIHEMGYLKRTPLEWARSNNHEEVVQYLESHQN